jgi:hypothetical protein
MIDLLRTVTHFASTQLNLLTTEMSLLQLRIINNNRCKLPVLSIIPIVKSKQRPHRIR